MYSTHKIRIRHAANALEQGKCLSIRAAARQFQVPRSTLSDYLNRDDMITPAHESQMRLTMIQEDWLCDWIIEEDTRGWPPSIQRVRDMATAILRAQGDETPLGKNWQDGFKKRNQRVKTMIGRRIEANRFNCATPEALNKFYDELEAVKSEFRVTDENTWNFDETGTGLGACTNGRVMASSSKKRTRCKKSIEREWVTSIECASATGTIILPLIIFKGASVQAQWFPHDHLPEWFYTHSQNGWTSNSHGLNWLKRIFIPQTTPSDPDAHRILICDGHGSHAQVDFMYEAYLHKIHLIFLPPHTSHILQPLDLTVFSILKQHYKKEVEALAILDDEIPVKKYNFIAAYAMARDRLSKQAIINGFRSSGIAPINRSKTLNSSQVPQTLLAPISPPLRPQDLITIETPYKSTDLSYYLRSISPTSLAITRRKIIKAVSLKDIELAQAQEEIRTLKRQLQFHTQNTKRKKVEVNPQDQFASIVAIKSAQAVIGLLERSEVIQTTARTEILPNQAISTTSDNSWRLQMEAMQSNWQVDPDIM